MPYSLLGAKIVIFDGLVGADVLINQENELVFLGIERNADADEWFVEMHRGQ